MKTFCVILLMIVALAFASALPANDGANNVNPSDINQPIAMEGEELQPEESRWGYGGWGGGYGGWGRGYGGGWGHGYGGGWGRGYGGGWGRGYGGGWGRRWGYGR